MLVFDSDLRVRLVAGPSAAGGQPGAVLVGDSVVAAIDPHGEQAEAIERAALGALAGEESAPAPLHGSSRTLRILPLEGGIDGGAAAVALLSSERSGDGAGQAAPTAELEDLRARGAELEELASATRALARSSDLQETRWTICRTLAGIARCDFVALIEPAKDSGSLSVTAAHGAELSGSVHIDQRTLAAEALEAGTITAGPELADDPEGAWPLGDAGARTAVWLPIPRDGAPAWLLALGWSDPDPPGERLLGTLGRIAEDAGVAIDRAEALARMTGMARTDPLTELSNRRAWKDELSRELARALRGGQQLSIGLVDLDELKAFNDRWGHAAGDRLLHTAAVRWRRRLRMTDLLARIGGDEFAITLPGCALGEAITLGDQLRGALPDGLSCSVGVAEWTAGEPVEALLKRADEALYQAKDGGRNRTVALPASN
jgi:diguanylate cyclase (GGDEF)-like protein